MLITAAATAAFAQEPAAIWAVVLGPDGWDGPPGGGAGGALPGEASFRSTERWGRLAMEVRGHVLHATPPRRLVWTGEAMCRLPGSWPRLARGGMLALEPVPGGCRATWSSFLSIPDTRGGRVLAWYVTRVAQGPEVLREQARQGLAAAGAALAVRPGGRAHLAPASAWLEPVGARHAQ